MFIRSTNMTGTLPCSFVADHPLRSIFLGWNKITGGA
jgi:hypothetical protein